MISVRFTILSLAVLFAFASTADAHRPDDFDGGKRAAFAGIVAKNKARLAAAGVMVESAGAAASSLSATATGAAATSGSVITRRQPGLTYAPCIRGMAAGLYKCDKIDMLAHVDITDLGVTFVNDIWGWTDRKTRREYALLGAAEGMVVIDISRPWRPKIKGILPARVDDPTRTTWRDIKVYKDHAFVVSEQRPHGMQVLDLRKLRSLRYSNEIVTFEADAVYDGFTSTHNIVINEDSGFAYAVGTNVCRGGLEIVDIRDPANPKDAGCFKEHGYVHDAQCVNYKGPDSRFRGREICFSAATANNAGPPFDNTLSIVDVTDKSDFQTISNTPYGDGFGYSHQGWLTPNQRYLIHDDELDEFFESVATTTTRLWDLTDLENPDLFATVTNGQTSIDHNLYTRGRYSYASNYTSGLRIFDISRVGNGEYKEVAFFDMYPENDNATFNGGTWSNYPYYKRRNVIAVSSMDRGLFILRARLGFGDDDDDDDGEDDDDN